jgi:hypothetical protein
MNADNYRISFGDGENFLELGYYGPSGDGCTIL